MTKEQLTEDIAKLEGELRIYLEFLADHESKEPGSLMCLSRAGRTEYYRLREDGTHEYLGKDRMDLIRKLAEKQHYEKMTAAAKRELAQLERCRKILERENPTADVNKVYGSLHRGIREVVGPINATDDGYAVRWLDHYRAVTNQTKAVSGPLKTLKGEYVRSKSEVIIADRLTAAGVPYVYEATTILEANRNRRLPDFYVLNKRTRTTFFWEHLGMLDYENYCLDAQKKLEAFAKKGYFPGKNLLLTFESGSRPLSTEYVDMLIKEFLL